MEQQELLQVSCTLTSEKFEVRSKSLGMYKVTGKSYTCPMSRISKDKMMVADIGMLRDDVWHMVHRTTYCLPEQLKQAEKIVRDAVIAAYDKRHARLKQMEQHYLNAKTNK
jgi:hypothetical protein